MRRNSKLRTEKKYKKIKCCYFMYYKKNRQGSDSLISTFINCVTKNAIAAKLAEKNIEILPVYIEFLTAT